MPAWRGLARQLSKIFPARRRSSILPSIEGCRVSCHHHLLEGVNLLLEPSAPGWRALALALRAELLLVESEIALQRLGVQAQPGFPALEILRRELAAVQEAQRQPIDHRLDSVVKERCFGASHAAGLLLAGALVFDQLHQTSEERDRGVREGGALSSDAGAP